MFAVKVVLVLIVWPHKALPPRLAKTGAGAKASAEPKTVKRSRAASRTFRDSLRLKTGYLVLSRVIYSLKRVPLSHWEHSSARTRLDWQSGKKRMSFHPACWVRFLRVTRLPKASVCESADCLRSAVVGGGGWIWTSGFDGVATSSAT
jgi:hypothetical protein